jgi:leucyl-tRNA synthetase
MLILNITKKKVLPDSYCLNLSPVGKEFFAAYFVLDDYGTGCVMAVPTHDQRDFEFAKNSTCL